MDMRHEDEFKVELIEDTEDSVNNVYSEKLSMIEEIRDTLPSPAIRIKCLNFFPFNCIFKERNSFEYIDVKSEIEVKKEPIDIEEEEEEAEEDPSDIEDEVKKENSDY
ncbi:hypothetical protein Avbf_18957 [Armadillidium vulgare]|nr:hypothetical protein Avbf_18957 [Armadillidium vulgare]